MPPLQLLPSTVHHLSWRVLICLIALCRAHYAPFSMAQLVLSWPNLHTTWQTQRHNRHAWWHIQYSLPNNCQVCLHPRPLPWGSWCCPWTAHRGSSTSALSGSGMLVWVLVAGFLPMYYFACVDKELFFAGRGRGGYLDTLFKHRLISPVKCHCLGWWRQST